MRIAPIALILASALALTACEEESAPDAEPVETGGEAAGDVLEGTISDDMLPLEELTSTSPPAERSASSNGASSSGESATAPAAPEPAGEPAPPEEAQAEDAGDSGETAE